MKPLDLFLPQGYHYRVRCSDYANGRDGGVVHIGDFGDLDSIAAKVKEAVCGTRITTFTGFNRERLQRYLETKELPRWAEAQPLKMCPKCVDYLRTKHVYQAELPDDQVKAVIACVLEHMVVLAPTGQRVQVDGAVQMQPEALSDIRNDLIKVLGLTAKVRDARVGAIFRRAVNRGKRLHPWEGRAHMLAAIESELAELKEADAGDDETAKEAEAIDVVVTAYRYYEGS